MSHLKTKISIASDHAGFKLKEALIDHLNGMGFTVHDCGCNSDSTSVDYPDYVNGVVNDILSLSSRCGLLICGTGVGMSVAANRNFGIRAALCYNEEIALLAREHNDANILSIAAGFVDEDEAREAIKLWIATPFSRDSRHITRNEMLDSIE